MCVIGERVRGEVQNLVVAKVTRFDRVLGGQRTDERVDGAQMPDKCAAFAASVWKTAEAGGALKHGLPLRRHLPERRR